jgi:hypothetical protein
MAHLQAICDSTFLAAPRVTFNDLDVKALVKVQPWSPLSTGLRAVLSTCLRNFIF